VQAVVAVVTMAVVVLAVLAVVVVALPLAMVVMAPQTLVVVVVVVVPIRALVVLVVLGLLLSVTPTYTWQQHQPLVLPPLQLRVGIEYTSSLLRAVSLSRRKNGTLC
jgi:hypothetical protein